MSWSGGKLPASPKQEPSDAYERITERILQILENGVIPWQSPSIARVGFPRNFSTGHFYQGINIFVLGSAEFQSPYFLTYLQAKEMGGQVRAGERGLPIIKVGTWEKDAKADQQVVNTNEETHKLKFLRIYTVFNACQIDGITFPETPPCPVYTESMKNEAARLIVAGMPKPPLVFEGRKACPHYVSETDTVEMPSRNTFRGEWRFYKTLFHELAHSTGHPSRLNRRSLVENRGMYAAGESRKIYCEEELVAEMTAAFLGAYAGIIEDDFENSASYLKGWLEVLRVKDNKRWLVQAASEAQKAADYILGGMQS
jgi:antirestriction protein ArdC